RRRRQGERGFGRARGDAGRVRHRRRAGGRRARRGGRWPRVVGAGSRRVPGDAADGDHRGRGRSGQPVPGTASPVTSFGTATSGDQGSRGRRPTATATTTTATTAGVRRENVNRPCSRSAATW